mgnify:CR=1 FL=1
MKEDWKETIEERNIEEIVYRAKMVQFWSIFWAAVVVVATLIISVAYVKLKTTQIQLMADMEIQQMQDYTQRILRETYHSETQ